LAGKIDYRERMHTIKPHDETFVLLLGRKRIADQTMNLRVDPERVRERGKNGTRNCIIDNHQW
jgi:hypothetical protein